MLDHRDVLLTVRKQVRTVQVASTGVTTLAATGTGFTRAAGSFIDDGFTHGMEVVPAGFGDNGIRIISSVSEQTITLMDADVDPRPEEAADAGRSLTVGIPPLQAWENVGIDPPDDRWFVEEDYIPGPSTYMSATEKGIVQHQPMYVLRLYGIADIGVTAIFEVSGSILKMFPPHLALTLSDGNHIRVRGNPAPYRGQVLPGEAGRARVAITIPLWAQTVNPI